MSLYICFILIKTKSKEKINYEIVKQPVTVKVANLQPAG
jgi:hypothetical protein